MSAPLSIPQKREIAIAASRAYKAWDGREAFEAVNSDRSRTDCMESWRHVEQGKAVGIQSLLEMTQDHYGRVLAHFLKLAGDEDGARRVLARDADNDRRVALYKLRAELQKHGLEEGYAAVICKSKFKRPLGEATAKQLWKLFFDVKNRPHRTPLEQLENEDPF